MHPSTVNLSVYGNRLGAANVFRLLHSSLLPDQVSVVMYHGLVDRRLPVPEWCFLHVDHFAAQMEYLAVNFTLMHLEDAFDPDRPRQERPIACVTFDDGFGSVHDLALPVLERISIPATVYLVTDLVDSQETVWFARLHQAISETDLSEVRMGNLRFPLGDSASRAAASASLQQQLKQFEGMEFDRVFEELLDRLGVKDSCARTNWGPARILRVEEIRRMSRNDLIRFGAHSASHRILSLADADTQRYEIERSVAAVASMVDRPSQTFAYPNGGEEDFDDRTVEAVRRAGIRYAVTTIEGPNARDVDPYRIRRYGIGAAHSFARFAAKVHHMKVAGQIVSKELRGARWAVGKPPIR